MSNLHIVNDIRASSITVSGKGLGNIATTDTAQTLSNKTFSSNLNMGGNRIIGLGTPTISTDAVTKSYTDSITVNLVFKQTCRVASTANIDLSTGTLLTIDTITLLAEDRVLVKDQTDAKENGIYIAGVGAWSRAEDFDGTPSNEIKGGTRTYVTLGSAGGGKEYVIIFDGNITIGVDNVVWSVVSSGGGCPIDFISCNPDAGNANTTSLNFYRSLDVVMTNDTAFSAFDNLTFNFTRIGNIVTITMPRVVMTENTGTLSFSGHPSWAEVSGRFCTAVGPTVRITGPLLKIGNLDIGFGVLLWETDSTRVSGDIWGSNVTGSRHSVTYSLA